MLEEPEALDSLAGEERNKVYRMLRLAFRPSTHGYEETFFQTRWSSQREPRFRRPWLPPVRRPPSPWYTALRHPGRGLGT
jgi:hypothetical protein